MQSVFRRLFLPGPTEESIQKEAFERVPPDQSVDKHNDSPERTAAVKKSTNVAEPVEKGIDLSRILLPVGR